MAFGAHFELLDVAAIRTRNILEERLKRLEVAQSDFLQRTVRRKALVPPRRLFTYLELGGYTRLVCPLVDSGQGLDVLRLQCVDDSQLHLIGEGVPGGLGWGAGHWWTVISGREVVFWNLVRSRWR